MLKTQELGTNFQARTSRFAGMVFTALHENSVRLSVRPSACLSVCPSNA